MKTLQAQLVSAIAQKLVLVRTERELRPIRILDVGIFPWHTSIELSFLCDGDTADPEDTADWPLYNFSNIYEGKWDAAKLVCEAMNAEWNRSHDIVFILRVAAAAIDSTEVRQAIHHLPRSSDFRVRILDPDDSDSPNYCS